MAAKSTHTWNIMSLNSHTAILACNIKIDKKIQPNSDCIIFIISNVSEFSRPYNILKTIWACDAKFIVGYFMTPCVSV